MDSTIEGTFNKSKNLLKIATTAEENITLCKIKKKLGSELSIIQINKVDESVNRIQRQLTSEITVLKTKPKVDGNLNKPQKELPFGLTITNVRTLDKTSEELNDKRFHCPNCLKTFFGRSGLYTHMKSHKDVKPFPCCTCGKNFSSSAYLACHMKLHTGVKPFACNICHRTFTNNGSLSAHKIIHADVKPFKCKLCNRDFSQEGNLKWHMKRSHDNKTDLASRQLKKLPLSKNLKYSEVSESTAWMLQFAD